MNLYIKTDLSMSLFLLAMDQGYSQPSDERSIILLGDTGAGKSAFGNFLLNRDIFKTGSGMLSTTQTVEQESCQYTEESLSIRLHVFDLPGLNDPRKVDIAHLNNTYSARKNCAKSMSTLFAIVIDISNRDELASTVLEIHNFLEKVELPDFNLTDNALVVFSHADKIGATPQDQESSLLRAIKGCVPLYKLWTLVRFRHVLVNSSCYSRDTQYRVEKMKEIIKFTQPRIRLLLLGPHSETQNELLHLLRGKCIGGVDALPGYFENEVDQVSTNFGGCSLTLEKSFDFSSLDSLSCSDNLEKSNALSQMSGLINSLVETHTFTAFCVLIRMDVKLKSSFINGIKSLANSISGDKPDMFYNRCFLLFTHSNCEDADSWCTGVFESLPAMRELRASMGNRVAIVNQHRDTSSEELCSFFRQVITFSQAMKQSCYGKEFVSSVLSTDLPAPPPQEAATNSCCLYLPSKQTLALLTIGGGGVLALAGAAAILSTGGAAIAVPMMLFTAKSPAVTRTLGVMGAGAVASAVPWLMQYKLHKKREEEREEYEYDFSSGRS